MTVNPQDNSYRSQTEPVKYIRNRDLLTEIHRSKSSYCSFIAPEYARYDLIVADVSDILKTIDAAKTKRAAGLSTKEAKVHPSSISEDDLIWRVMTGEHIPDDLNRKRRAKGPNEFQARTNFPPFKHYILKDGQPFEVGRSHWKGGLHNGEFSTDHGRIGHRLAQMFMLLVDRYSGRSNWRGYCVDDQTEALTQRGWVAGDELRTDDMILSYKDKKLTWSTVKSIYRDTYEGNMFHLTGSGMDALVTPGHKFVTDTGIKPVELLCKTDNVILSGEGSPDTILGATYIAVPFSEFSVTMEPYNGTVWCPETEYGSFIARRNGYAYLTGNSYVDEMRNHALLQLTMIGLQFDESKSDNPFAFYTTVTRNCFTRVLNLEKRGQHIRDDLLMMAGAAPSFSRQIDHEMEQAKAVETPVVPTGEAEGTESTIIVPVKTPAKRGRKPGVKKAAVPS
jgi:hypothetical protein